MTAPLNYALEDAIRRACALGRVDQSIGFAAAELRRMVAAEPHITPGYILWLYGEPASARRRYFADWDYVLWRVADLWRDVYRGLQRRPARQLPAFPYSVITYALPAREAAATQR